MEPIATTADAWDRDPWAILRRENGVVDLRMGQLHPGPPEEMISRSLTGIDYDPDATCPRSERFLAEVFAGDDELVDWYRSARGAPRRVGIAKEVLAGHHGLCRNGKSKFTDAIRGAFGEYAVVIPVETLVSAKRSAGEATPDLIPLRGARLGVHQRVRPDREAPRRRPQADGVDPPDDRATPQSADPDLGRRRTPCTWRPADWPVSRRRDRRVLAPDGAGAVEPSLPQAG